MRLEGRHGSVRILLKVTSLSVRPSDERVFHDFQRYVFEGGINADMGAATGELTTVEYEPEG